LGRVLAISGSQLTVGLSLSPAIARATVGKFLGVISGTTIIVGMITEIAERLSQEANCRTTATIDLVGEIKANSAGAPFFQRGITEYPMIGEAAIMMGDRELRLIYNGNSRSGSCNVGVLQQDQGIPATSMSIIWSASISPCSAPLASASRTASLSCFSRS
jgi:hypothetical protein